MRRFTSYFLMLFLNVIVFTTEGVAQNSALSKGGQIDFSFQMSRIYPPAESSYPPLIIQPDGKILAVGKFSSETGGISARKLYRFLPNGQTDTTFNPFYSEPNIRIENTALQPDGKIIYLYVFLDDQRYTALKVVRLNEDGSRDTSFNYVPYHRANWTAFTVLPFADGTIWISGSFVERGDFPAARQMLKINPDGSLDQNFIQNYNSGGSSKMQQLPDGKILSIGFGLRRLNSDGTIDPTFAMHSLARDFIVQPDQKIILSSTNNDLIRLLPNGAIDTEFTSLPLLSNFQIARRSDGELILSSYRCIIFSNCRTYFEHLNSNGTFKRQFNSRFVRGNMSMDANDRIYIKGEMFIDRRTVGIVRIRTEYTPTRSKAFDFNGDGKSDISVYRPTEGNWYIYYSSSNNFEVRRFGIAEDLPVPADYDGDNVADVAVYRPSIGTWFILRSSDGLVAITRFGLAEDIPTQNDYDGDGKADISLFRPSTGVWYRINSSSGAVGATEFGTANARTVSGDYDGDGKADLAYWATAENSWRYISTISGAQVYVPVNFYETDLAAPADYDGDSRIDRAFYKNHNGSWYGSYSLSGSGFYIPWGISGDIPVPADYDGDEREDFAVWRPSTGEWWIGQSSNGQYFSLPFGQAGDIPIPSAFVR